MAYQVWESGSCVCFIKCLSLMKYITETEHNIVVCYVFRMKKHYFPFGQEVYPCIQLLFFVVCISRFHPLLRGQNRIDIVTWIENSMYDKTFFKKFSRVSTFFS